MMSVTQLNSILLSYWLSFAADPLNLKVSVIELPVVVLTKSNQVVKVIHLSNGSRVRVRFHISDVGNVYMK